MIFYPADIFHFHSIGFHLGSQLGSLLQKCDPDRCDQNVHKNRLCFFYPADIFHFHSFGCHLKSNLDPCGKSVVLAGAIKIHIKVAYDFFTQ